MKKTFIAVLALLLTATLFLPHTSAQAARPIVRLIYFVPKDVQPRPDINAQLDTHIKGVQRLLADEMERHGFGRKTFQFETDVHGNAVVHHIKGQAADSYYRQDPFGKVSDEILEQEQFDREKDIYLVALDRKREILEGFGELCGVQPQAGIYGWNEGGAALIPAGCLEGEFPRDTTAHELLHTFGLEHDFRDDTYIMSFGEELNRLSQCAAEWLDVHRAFNAGQTAFNEPATIEMLPPSLASPPNAIRLRFRVTDADGLHQAQILKADQVFTPGNLEMIGYKRLDGRSRTVEFVTTALVSKSPSVTLQVIDARGHFIRQSFPIDIVPLLPPAKVVSIPDENLAAAVRETLNLAPDDTLTTQTLLELTLLEAPNREIRDLTGLEHAHNLRYLDLGAQERNGKWRNSNVISNLAPLSELTHLKTLILVRSFFPITELDFLRQPPPFKVVSMPDPNLAAAVREVLEMSPNEALTTYTMLSLTHIYARNRGIRDLTGLEHAVNLKVLDLADEFIPEKGAVNSNAVTDISPLQTLTQLEQLWLSSTSISDVTPLQTLTQLEVLWLDGTSVSDVSPLLGLNLTGTSWDSIGLYLWGCPLSYASIHTHIPVMQAKGVEVAFDNVAHPALMKISGDRQENTVGSTLAKPFVVEAINAQGKPIKGVTVTFTITHGSETRRTITAKTGTNGRARTQLKLGQTPGTWTITATAPQIPSPTRFTAQATPAEINPIDLSPVVHGGAGQLPPMFWIETTSRRLYRKPAGPTVKNIVPSVQNATSIAVDAARNKVYWTEKTGTRSGRIRVANFNGSNVELVKDLTSVPRDLAIDSAGGKLYLTNSWGKIQRLNVDGSTFQSNLITGLTSPQHLALDVAGGKVYWTGPGSIWRANLNGQNREKLIADLGEIGSIAVAGNRIYWTEKNKNAGASGKVRRAALDGSNVQTLATLQSVPIGIAVDTAVRRLYWTNTGGKIQRATLAGKQIQNLVTEAGMPADIALGRASTGAAPAASAVLPDTTALLPNYPNPFNPDTWIPYQLAKTAEVTVTIHAANGAVVRTLALGHQRAGRYENRSRAAYWDGRNAVGERVASGIYFYTLQTGDFAATRKMLIVK